MAGRKAERRVRSKPQIPCILPSEASAILERCERILEGSRELLGDLQSVGIAELFARLDDSVLQLAIQPDSWGERTRARLMSDLVPALCATMSPGSVLNIEDVVRVTNAVTPCFLLELGRRKGHIQVEFPRNPALQDASFRLSVSPSVPLRTMTADKLSRIVDQVGEALVGLCYFGDNESRDIVEAQLIESARA
jgi:hypothetical protein